MLYKVGCLIPWSTQAQVTPDSTTSTTVNQDENDFAIEQGDRTIIILMFHTGLKAAEVCQLKSEHIHLRKRIS